MSRLWETIKSRLTDPPLPLKAHALAMLALPVVVAGPESGYRWFGLAVVGIVLWPLLRGSLDAWWIQAGCIALSAIGLAATWRYVSGEHPGFSVFVSPATFGTALALLTIAGATLLAPDTRAFCRVSRGPARKMVGFTLVALFLGYLPASALSLQPRLPSTGNYDRTPDLAFVGSDRSGPSALFVGGRGDEVCLVVLAPRSSSRSCHHGGLIPDHPQSVRTEHLHAWVLPPHAVRVEVAYESGRRRDARPLADPAGRAKVFVVTESLDDVRRMRAYDASGRTIAACPC